MQTPNDPFERFLEHPNLPSPAGVALEVLELVEKPDVGVDEFVDLIRTDPGLAQRILQIVNSPFAGMSRPIADVRPAAILLGIRTVAVVALGVSIIDSSKEHVCKAFAYRTFWSRSLARAVAMQQIAHQSKGFTPQETFTLGLLADVGRLVFANVTPHEYAPLLQRTDDPDRLATLERETFAVDRDQLTAHLLQTWGLPTQFRDAVLLRSPAHGPGMAVQERVRVLADMLEFAHAVSNLMVLPIVDAEELATLAKAAEPLGYSPDLCDKLFDQTAEEWRRSGTVLDITTNHVPLAADIYARASAKSDELRQAGHLHHFIK